MEKNYADLDDSGNFWKMSDADFYFESENFGDELCRLFLTTRKVLRDELRHLDNSGILKATNANL